jgi:exoribonuclease-2
LRWVQQQGVTEIEAPVMKDGLVRADTLPLVFRVPGTESLPRNTRIRARVAGIDLLTLDLHATLAARLDAAPVDAAAPAEEALDEEAEPTGAIELAIRIDEPAAEGPPEAAAAAPAATDPA